MLDRTRLTAVCAAAFAFAIATAGCGDTGGGGDGGSQFCSGDSSCKTGEICHPTAKTCVKTCMLGADCPSSAKNCAIPQGGAAGSAMVCNCSTTALCAAGTSGTVCSTVDAICLNKCTSDSSCPSGRTCDTASGQCNAAGGGDAGMDAGTMDAGLACSLGTCPTGSICSFLSNTCETPKTCSSTTPPQPDVCGYGQVCNTTTCAEIVPGACANFPSTSPALTWDPTMLSSAGPVIFSINKFSFGVDATFCGGTTATQRAKIHVKAYSEQTVLISETNQPALKYVKSDMTEIAVGATQIQNYTSKAGGKEAEFDINFCYLNGTTTASIGLYYTGGNAACFTIN